MQKEGALHLQDYSQNTGTMMRVRNASRGAFTRQPVNVASFEAVTKV
jgi:hypothetical protein